MTLMKIYKKELGKNWEKEVSPRLLKLVKKIDSLPGNKKVVSSKLLKKALS